MVEVLHHQITSSWCGGELEEPRKGSKCRQLKRKEPLSRFSRRIQGWSAAVWMLAWRTIVSRTEYAADVYVGGTCPIAGRRAPGAGSFVASAISSCLPHRLQDRMVKENSDCRSF